VGVGGEARIEHQVAGILPMVFLPEGEEAEDLFGFLALAQIGVRVAKRPSLGVLGQKGEYRGLPSAAHRDVVALDLRVLPIIGHRMEIEIERVSGEQPIFGDRAVPGREQAGGAGVVQARGILREVALLRNRVEPAKERQARVGHQRHHVALALNRPELQHERGA